MSLVDLPPRVAGHSSDAPPPASKPYNEEEPRQVYHSDDDYTENMYEQIYNMEDTEKHNLASEPQRTDTVEEAPALPPKSALRASRLLDGLSILKMEATDLGATTPHDVYLSSEEDASSSADDFSDYDYDSASDGILSPSRASHEDTARVVSLVFYGKPHMIDLDLRRRSIATTNSSETHSRTGSSSSKASSSMDRPLSIASSISSVLTSSPKKTDHLLKKRPPFLNLDPFANGSTYSLTLPKDSADREVTPTQNTISKAQPKTPTQQLMKGVSRTFSLVRKKSRPMLNAQYMNGSPLRTPSPEHKDEPRQTPERRSSSASAQSPASPSVTFQDIVRAARKNSVMLPPQPELKESPEAEEASSGSPTPAKRGILDGLAARRRSFKFTGKPRP